MRRSARLMELDSITQFPPIPTESRVSHPANLLVNPTNRCYMRDYSCNSWGIFNDGSTDFSGNMGGAQPAAFTSTPKGASFFGARFYDTLNIVGLFQFLPKPQ